MRRALIIVMSLLGGLLVAGSAEARRPTTGETLAAAQRLGVGPEAAALRERFLPAARLLPVKGRAAPLGATRFGGRPDLPRGARWPRCHGHPLTFVAQVDLAALAAAVPGATRGRGTLSLFVGTRVGPDGATELIDVEGGPVARAKCLVVRHTPANARLARRRPPTSARVFPVSVRALRPTLTVPDWEVAQDLLGRDLKGKRWDGWVELVMRTALGDLRRKAADAPVRQLLGWSQPLQEDPTARGRCHGQPARLLLQFNSREPYDIDWSEGGALMLTIGASDLRAGRFGALCAEHQLG